MFLLIPLHSSVTNVRRVQTNLILFLLSIYFFESFEVFIQLETTRNCLKPGPKQGDMESSYCSYQNQFMFFNDTVVCRNNIEVITYSYGRGNTSLYFLSQYFFSRSPFSSYTDMSECRPRR